MNTPSEQIPPSPPEPPVGPPATPPPGPPATPPGPPPQPPPSPPQPPQPGSPPQPPLAAGAADPQQRQWAMFAHLSAILGGLLSSTFGGIAIFVGPLVIWLVKKDTMPFVDDQGKEALNFNITVAIACLVLLVLSVFTLGIGLIVAIPLWLVIAVIWLIFTVVATIKANEGVAYRYPFTLRLIK